MAHVPGREVSGKRFVPLLFLGIVVFCLVMAIGTRLIADAATPWFKARFERQQAELKAQRAEHPAPVAP
ncbi:hypothetical protein EON79_21700 [bacterium]|nr:MAG: hypothetical protein EON79_21700 [bacterium]